MAYLSSTLLPQRGAHPVSTNHIGLDGATVQDSCSLHLYYNLPPIIFVDTHELAQRSASYSFIHWGTRDLEKPVHAVEDEPSHLLINVQGPTATTVEVPMHLRYGIPTNIQEDYQSFEIPRPEAFLRCSSTSGLSESYTTPQLPAHILSSPALINASLFSIPSNQSATHDTIIIPVGNTPDLSVVEPSTVVTILLCFLWLFKTALRLSSRLTPSPKAKAS